MLTESLPTVTELQPLDGSVDAVWAHDRPDNKQKHSRLKNISTSCLQQSLCVLRALLFTIIKSSQDFVIVFLPPSLLQAATCNQ